MKAEIAGGATAILCKMSMAELKTFSSDSEIG